MQLLKCKAHLCSSWAATRDPIILIPTPFPITIRVPPSRMSQLQLTYGCISSIQANWLIFLRSFYITLAAVKVIWMGITFSFTLELFLIPWVAWRNQSVTKKHSNISPQQGLTSATLELCTRIVIYLKIISTCLWEQIRDINLGLERRENFLSSSTALLWLPLRGDGSRLIMSQPPLSGIWTLILCQPEC